LKYYFLILSDFLIKLNKMIIHTSFFLRTNKTKTLVQKLLFLIFTPVFLFTSCSQKKELSAQEIVDFAILASGTHNFANAKVSFDFRNKSYTSIGECGAFHFKRKFTSNDTLIEDDFDQKKLTRKVNGEKIKLNDSIANLYAESINSVFYFVQLPYRLNDEAVQKELLGQEKIHDKEYFKIQVTFQEDGGGQDYEDIYLYWINSENYSIDYLAYSFLVNGGGLRFREAYNAREVNGIKFVDYRNFDVQNKHAKLEELGQLHEKEELKLLSTIEKSNIKVKHSTNTCK